jgi:hypothetical protein
VRRKKSVAAQKNNNGGFALAGRLRLATQYGLDGGNIFAEGA